MVAQKALVAGVSKVVLVAMVGLGLGLKFVNCTNEIATFKVN